MGASVGRLYPMPWWKSEKKLLYKLHSSNAEWRAFLIKILNRPRRYLLFTRETLMNVSVLAWSWSPGVIISRVSKKSADCAQWWPQWSVIPRGIYLLLIYSLNELIITLRKKKTWRVFTVTCFSCASPTASLCLVFHFCSTKSVLLLTN